MANKPHYKPIVRILLVACLLVPLAHPAMAGTTGKITGLVAGSGTGEPLVGVNVVLQGTSMGAATDQSGFYVILNVPPGTYAVVATAIGYATRTTIGVQVDIDLTTPLNFQMESEVLAGQAVVVTASVRAIKRDVAASQKTISADRIIQLPVGSVTEVLGLEAGITSGLSIRGSGSDEALFMVDGIVLRDERNNQPITQIPLSAISQISVQTGGFSAEYNNVRAGVINVVTKEGHPDFYGGTFTMKYRPPSAKHFGSLSPYDADAFWLRPFLDPAVAWTGTANGEPYEDTDGNGRWDDGEPFTDYDEDGVRTFWDQYTLRQYTSFQGWNAVSAQTLADGDQATNLSPSAAQKVFRYEHRKQGDIVLPDYNIDFGFGGPVPFVSRALGDLRFYASYRGIQTPYVFRTNREALTDNTLMLKVTSNLSPAMKLTVLSLTGQTYATSATGFGTEPGGTSYFTSVGGVVSTIDRIGHTLSWRLYTNDYWARTQVNSSTLSAQLNHLLSDRSYYNLIVKRTAKRYQTGPGRPRRADEFEIVNGYLINEDAPFGWEGSPVFALGDGMGMGGSVSTARDSSSHTNTTATINYVRQLSAHHELSTGFQLTYDKFDLKFGAVNLALPEGNTWTEFQRNPYRLMTFFEDKIETDGYVALLGLTLDYVNPNGDWISLENPYSTDFASNAYDPGRADEFEYEPAEANFYLSPRLGIAHPITESSKLYFNYGHYLAMPRSDRLYREQRGAGFVLDRLGDPSLPLERTIAYELGFDQSLGAGLLLHFAAYYKDITHQQSWTRYINIKGNVNYRQLTDKNYGDIRGLEIDLSKNLGRWLTGNVNFEYRVSTSGYFDLPPIGGITYLYENPADQRQYLRDRHSDQSRPLPRPRFKSNLALHTPAEFGPGRLGEALLGGWLLNFVGRWTDGAWFTWNPNNIPGQTNNVRWKPFMALDLKASKTVSLGGLRATFFVDVNNLLNLKDFSGESFYNAFDYNDYFYSLHLPAGVISKLGTNYPGIAGDDRPGDVRDAGVAFAPIEWVASVDRLPATEPLIEADRELYYYVSDTEQYMAWAADGWVEADAAAIQRVLDTRAYIDMPNHTYFTFLNPRAIFFGLTLALDFN